MATTTKSYTVVGGSLGPYTYPFDHIDDGDVAVTVNSVLQTVTTDYTLDSPNKRITFQSGKFTKEWMDECKNGQKNFLATRAKLAEHPVEKVGATLRAMMPWIGKKKLVDSDKS